MSESLSLKNLDWFGRLALIQGFILILFFLGLISYSISYSEAVRPYFIIICIYYWAIYRPSLLPPAYVFCLGLVFDFILSYPVGLHSIFFITAQWIIRDQRLYFLGQPYMIVWAGFFFTCLVIMSLEWLFFSVLLGHQIAFNVVLYGTMVTAFSFPIIALLFKLIQRILPPASQPYFL